MEQHKKLVRDRIPEIIRENGETPHTRTLGDDEYKAELKKKVWEEAGEVMSAIESDAPDDIIKEIGDVQEVLDAIIDAFDLGTEEVARTRAERLRKRGGFEKRIFLDSVE